MTVPVGSLGFLLAAPCAAIMGFAVQRGATCTVVAVEEVISHGSFRRFFALVEASAWVLGGLLVAQALGQLDRVPPDYPLSVWTVLGGALLGFGAFVNRACVFGAIARFGSGEWAYLATPLGFYVGCLSFRHIPGVPSVRPIDDASLSLQAPAWAAALFVAFMVWRILRPVIIAYRRAGPNDMSGRWYRTLPDLVWSPHAATTVIGIAFLVMLLLVGAWGYTDVLMDLARGMAGNLVVRVLLAVALLLGAVLGGWTAGRFGSKPMTPGQVPRCFLGGVIMAWGGLLIPGGNDGLILVGMPLMWPYAWGAFLAMCMTIGVAQMLQHRSARSSFAA